MGVVDRLRVYKLRANIALGRQTWGRQGPPPRDLPTGGSGGGVNVNVPVEATISAVVIRADGTREELGTIYSGTSEISSEDLDRLERAAQSGDDQ